MHLTPREKDKLLVAMAANVARRRLERGVKLNHPESVALISDFIVEGARDGRSVADLMQAGAHVPRRNPISIEVANTGDRPIQVGSHYHFFETNEALKFDRKRTKGMRLDIAAGTAVRFEPGQSRTVRLTPYMGGRESHGFQAKVSGKLGPVAKVGRSNEGPTRISRAAYVHMFGPTVGDKVRLADTDLFVAVEKDHTTYGDEVKF